MNKYRIRFSWAVDGKTSNAYDVHVKDFEAPTPISALNQFHAFMQHVREQPGQGIGQHGRPALKPHEYAIESLHQFYHAASLHVNPHEQPIIESRVDMPHCLNPDLTKVGKGSNAFDKEPEFDFSDHNRSGLEPRAETRKVDKEYLS